MPFTEPKFREREASPDPSTDSSPIASGHGVGKCQVEICQDRTFEITRARTIRCNRKATRLGYFAFVHYADVALLTAYRNRTVWW